MIRSSLLCACVGSTELQDSSTVAASLFDGSKTKSHARSCSARRAYYFLSLIRIWVQNFVEFFNTNCRSIPSFTPLQAFMRIHWLVLSIFNLLQSLQLLECFCSLTQSFSMSLRSLMIEVNPLLYSFLNVADWNKITSFLIPLALNFFKWNLATGVLLPKTVSGSQYRGYLMANQHDLLVRLDAIALVLMLHKLLHKAILSTSLSFQNSSSVFTHLE